MVKKLRHTFLGRSPRHISDTSIPSELYSPRHFDNHSYQPESKDICISPKLVDWAISGNYLLQKINICVKDSEKDEYKKWQ